MRRTTLILAALTVSAFASDFPILAQSHWEFLDGPPGSDFSHIAANTNGIVIASPTRANVFLSRDNGESWEQTAWFGTWDERDYVVNELAVAADGSLLASVRAGVYISNNLGESWKIAYPHPAQSVIMARANTLYLIDQKDDNILHTEDGGRNWINCTKGLPDGISPIGLLDHTGGGIFTVLNNGVLFNYDNSSSSWNKLLELPGKEDNHAKTTMSALNDRRIVIKIDHWPYLVQTDPPKYSLLQRGLSGVYFKNDVHQIPATGELFAVAQFGSIYRFDPNVGSWTRDFGSTNYRSPSRNIGANALTVNGNGELIAAKRDGTYFRDAESSKYTLTNGGLAATYLQALHINERGTIFCALSDKSLVRGSIATGAWEPPVWLDSTARFISQAHTDASGIVYVGLDERLYQSDDDGASWRNLAEFPETIWNITTTSFQEPLVLLEYGNVMLWNRQTEAWELVSENETSGWDLTRYAGGSFSFVSGKDIWRSNDDGRNWSLLTSLHGYVKQPGHITSFIDHDELGWFAASSDGVLRSMDKGLSWESILNDTPFGSLLTFNTNDLLVRSSKQILISTNKGLTWQAHTDGLRGDNIIDIVEYNERLYVAVAGQGLYRSVAVVNSVENSKSVNKRLRIVSVLPQPIQDEAFIVIRLDKPAIVQSVLLDALGREVTQITNRFFRAGQHKLLLNAGQLLSGVYLLHTVTDGLVTVQRIVIRR